MIDPFSLFAGGIWIGGAILGCWGVYCTRGQSPKRMRYVIAVTWPIALLVLALVQAASLIFEGVSDHE